MKLNKIVFFIIALFLSINIVSAASYSQNGGTATLYGTQTYDYFNLTNGAVVNIAPYNGTSGTGTLYLNLLYDLNIDSTSSINGAGRGYRGGAAPSSGSGGYGGELQSYGGGTSGTIVGQNGGGGGGGGGYATTGGNGGAGMSGSIGGTGGLAQGTISGYDIQMGNGAGSSGGHYNGISGVAGNPGGAMLKVNSRSAYINGFLYFNGSTGGSDVLWGSWSGGGGGGASGGGILLNASSIINITNADIYTAGGAGGTSTYASAGGAGSGGRLKLFYSTLFNTSTTIVSGSTYYGVYGGSNDYTDDGTLTFSVLKNTQVIFNYNGVISGWYVDNVNQGSTSPTFTYTLIKNNASTYINATTTGANISWNVTSLIYPYRILSPTNGSTVSKSTNLIFQEWPHNGTYTIQVATDSAFTNIVSSGNPTSSNQLFTYPITVSTDDTFYWHVKNSTVGTYGATWEFTTNSSISPGYLNVYLRGEESGSSFISNATVYLYSGIGTDSLQVIKTITAANAGWANFTPSDGITQIEYLVRAVPTLSNSSYKERSVLTTPNITITMYLPNSATSNVTENILQLNDVSGRFPYTSTKISIWSAGTLKYSNYFSIEGTVTVFLIEGQQYTVTLQHGNNIFNYGYFVSYASETYSIIVPSDMVDTEQITPFISNVTWSTTDITLMWNLTDSNRTLTSLNWNVYKNNMSNNVQNFSTTLRTGSSIYTVTDINDIYYTTLVACYTGTTTCVTENTVIDYRLGRRQNSTGVNPWDGSPIGIGMGWDYQGLSVPQWVLNLVSLILFIVLMASAGALHIGIIRIMALIMLLLFEAQGWFMPIQATDSNNYTTMAATAGLIVLSIAYYLSNRR